MGHKPARQFHHEVNNHEIYQYIVPLGSPVAFTSAPARHSSPSGGFGERRWRRQLLHRRPFFALRARAISIELLVTIAAVGAVFIGEYWESAAVTFLFVLGGYLEARTLARTRSALKDMLALAPTEVTVFRNGSEINVASHEVIPGETVVVRPGGRIGVDGAILSGRSAIDESAITGEPIPAEKQVGDKVFAGTVSHNGYLEIHAEGVGADTTLARIIQRVEEAQRRPRPRPRE
ncbi:cation-translocating P-type ATPase [Marinobacter sp. ELB17]|uniref:P-type ATPase n=1 Tax=Marinobacter sp. ELB17 TaxID=270374 RepID=UPI0000F39A5B|nr:cation-translocating P-type ATPase [Marinobacter sp. ELB17]EAZ99704.1 cadmium transporting P-type ATPase [Marinobacter sp. ELB17]